ncbi:protein of unknown function [Methylocaldum szegediense]|uniref:Uncharacterized protein n=1 Tax=Methylocaldum szegediense TaxID=73780 RepID=A0ABM9HXW2_9GAMM|nr:protein of unknown function [Methylocaldum szegediense]
MHPGIRKPEGRMTQDGLHEKLSEQYSLQHGQVDIPCAQMEPVLWKDTASSTENSLCVTSRMIIYREGVMLCSKPGAFSRRYSVRPSEVSLHADSSS